MESEQKQGPEAQEQDTVLESLTGAPETLLVKGKEYTIYPLDLVTMTLLRRWAKSLIVTETRENLALIGSDATEDLIKLVWEGAYAKLSDPLISDAMESPEAIQYWVYLSMKRGNDAITEEQVSKLLVEVNLVEVLEKLMRLNGVGEDTAGNEQMAQLLKERRLRTGQKSS